MKRIQIILLCVQCKSYFLQPFFSCVTKQNLGSVKTKRNDRNVYCNTRLCLMFSSPMLTASIYLVVMHSTWTACNTIILVLIQGYNTIILTSTIHFINTVHYISSFAMFTPQAYSKRTLME